MFWRRARTVLFVALALTVSVGNLALAYQYAVYEGRWGPALTRLVTAVLLFWTVTLLHQVAEGLDEIEGGRAAWRDGKEAQNEKD